MKDLSNLASYLFDIPLPFSIYRKNMEHSIPHAPHFLSLQQFLNLPFLPFQIALLLIQVRW